MNNLKERFLRVLHNPFVAMSLNIVICTAVSFHMAFKQGRLEELQHQLQFTQWWHIPAGLAIGVLSYFWSVFMTESFGHLIKNDTQPRSRHHAMIRSMMGNRWLFPLIALAGWGEELLFRGTFQPLFIATMKSRAAPCPTLVGILLTALLFGFVHRDKSGKFLTPQHVLWFIIITMQAILWGWVVYATDNLWPAIAAHGLNNLLVSYRGYMFSCKDEREDMAGDGNESSPTLSPDA